MLTFMVYYIGMHYLHRERVAHKDLKPSNGTYTIIAANT